jgi:hypothetical protein
MVEWESQNAGATDHIHVTLDAEPYVGGQALTGNYTFTDVAPGPHTITVQIADMTHTVYTNPEATDTVNVTVEAASADTTPPDPVFDGSVELGDGACSGDGVGVGVG